MPHFDENHASNCENSYFRNIQFLHLIVSLCIDRLEGPQDAIQDLRVYLKYCDDSKEEWSQAISGYMGEVQTVRQF